MNTDTRNAALRDLTLPQCSAIADLLGLDEFELAKQVAAAIA